MSDVGWMGELPDDVAQKIPVEATAVELAGACARLLDDPGSRGKLAEGARAYAEDHSFKAAARSLLEVVNRARAQPKSQPVA